MSIILAVLMILSGFVPPFTAVYAEDSLPQTSFFDDPLTIVETFDNASLTTAYADGSFTGAGGVTWTYVHSRDQDAVNNYGIDGNGLMLRRGSDSKLTSSPILTGVGSISLQVRKAFTGTTERRVKVLINGQEVGKTQVFGTASGADSTVIDLVITDINIQGPAVIEIALDYTDTTNRQVTIDNIAWTPYNGPGSNKLILSASPEGTDVVSGATVLLTTNDPNATIHYTKDNSDVTTSSPVYISGVKIEGDIGDKVTLKALAVAEGKEDSDIFVREYTIKDPNDVMNIKEVLALPSGTENVQVRGTIVYFATGFNNPVIHSEIDGEIYALYIFGSAPQGAKIGDEVRFTGTYSIRYGAPQLASSSAVFIQEGTKIEPLEITINEILTNGAQYLNRFVVIRNVELGAFTSNNTPVTDATGTINIYQATAYPVQVEAGDVVDLYAMVSTHNSTRQLRTGTVSGNGFNIYDITNDTKPPVVTLRETYPDARPNQNYTIAVSAEDNKGVDTVTLDYAIGATTSTNNVMVYNATNLEYTFTIDGSLIPTTEEEIIFTVKATDVSGLTTITDARTILIDSRPQVLELSPARNASTGEDKSPMISVKLGNAGDNPDVKLSLKKDTVSIFENQVMTVTAEADVYQYATTSLEDGLYSATVVVTRTDSATITVTWNFTVGEQSFKPYFGQLHAHTAEYSDGSGTLANALTYLKNLPSNENVHFISITDHSNYFDTTAAANPAAALNDKSLMTAASLEKWNSYVSAMDLFNDENHGSLAVLAGFEMTWSGGPGHINTFNSDGLISRNNTTLNNKTADGGLRAYYDELIKNTDPLANLSQFNHPGATFGTFSDFAYWSPTIDSKMVAVEIGNGEGAIGSGGYFPSYTEYTKALDKGWHVAPTNNQDNHRGRWGNSNTARTVIITDELSDAGLLTGLKNMSVYATEDQNLNIFYTVNNQMMGSIISDVPTTPLQFVVNVDDPDADDVIAKIEIITNSGRIAKSETFTSNAVEWEFELEPIQGYYYVRVTQADKNIAVTAPVWIGQAPLVGINSIESSTKMPVTNEALTITTTLFNNESTGATFKSIDYSMNGVSLMNDTPNSAIGSAESVKHEFEYTPTQAGKQKIAVTVVLAIDGQDRSFTQEIEINVRDSEKLVYIGIDASHFNEYVRGNYKDSMGNFAELAVDYDVRVVELETSESLIAATQNDKYQMIILTPPTRRNGSNFLIGYKNYTDEEIAALKAFAESGKTIIITGWSDAYENYTKYSDNTPYSLPAEDHMSAQQNKLLAALGATLRISDDEIRDDVNNGGQAQRLYLTNYNMDNPFLQGVKPSEQVYSNYGGASIYAVDGDGIPSSNLPSSVSPMVFGFETSYSSDRDGDGTTGHEGINVPKYDNKYMVAASEQVVYENGNTANIIVAGAAFMSNFEIQVSLDSYATPAYSNYTILENIVQFVNPVVITPIADVHLVPEGQKFTIQGIATSNASGYDRDTAFFDSIYVQDSTAGINLFPVAGDVRAGQLIQVTGVTSSYNGERQLNVEKIEVINSEIQALPAPIVLTTAQAKNAENLGSLVQVSGTITELDYANGIIESIFIKDDSNVVARVFIDGYITSTKVIENLQVGSRLTAVGLSSIDPDGPRVRVRDRADITCTLVTPDPSPTPTPTPDDSDVPSVPGNGNGKPAETVVPVVVNTTAEEVEVNVDSAKLIEAANTSNTVVLEVPASVSLSKPVEVKLPAAAMKELATGNTNIVVKVGEVSFTLNSKFAEVEGDVTILMSQNNDVEYASESGLTPIGMAYNFDILADGKKVEGFSVKPVIQVALDGKSQNPENVGVYVQEADGSWTFIMTYYNEEDDAVYFKAPHFSVYAFMEYTKTFEDIKTHWAKAHIEAMASKRITAGVTETLFAPDRTITRAEFAVMLLNALGEYENGKGTFNDVASGKWYAGRLALAKDLGIIEADKLGNFRPDENLTRQEMAAMVSKAHAILRNIDLTDYTPSVTFTDASSIDAEYSAFVSYAQKNEIIVGFNNEFKPLDLSSRAQALTVIRQMLKK